MKGVHNITTSILNKSGRFFLYKENKKIKPNKYSSRIMGSETVMNLMTSTGSVLLM